MAFCSPSLLRVAQSRTRTTPPRRPLSLARRVQTPVWLDVICHTPRLLPGKVTRQHLSRGLTQTRSTRRCPRYLDTLGTTLSIINKHSTLSVVTDPWKERQCDLATWRMLTRRGTREGVVPGAIVFPFFSNSLAACLSHDLVAAYDTYVYNEMHMRWRHNGA